MADSQVMDAKLTLILDRINDIAKTVKEADPAKKAKKVVAPKDPNCPKKPPSSFLAWSSANKVLIAQKLQDEILRIKAATNVEPVKKDVKKDLVAKMWATISPTEKTLYEKQYADNNVIYKQAKEAYEKAKTL